MEGCVGGGEEVCAVCGHRWFFHEGKMVSEVGSLYERCGGSFLMEDSSDFVCFLLLTIRRRGG